MGSLTADRFSDSGFRSSPSPPCCVASGSPSGGVARALALSPRPLATGGVDGGGLGLVALVTMSVAHALDVPGLTVSFSPLVFPHIPLLPVVGILVALVPAVVAPNPSAARRLPAMSGGVETDEPRAADRQRRPARVDANLSRAREMIRFDQVSFTYNEAEQPTLHRVSLDIPEGELCVVVGETGTGKSTFLRAINGLVPHFSGGTLAGTVTVDGRTTKDNRPRDLADVVGFVGQNPLASFVTETVEDELAYTMENLGVPSDAMRRRVEDAVDLLGLSDLREPVVAHLVGRAATARGHWSSADCVAATPRARRADLRARSGGSRRSPEHTGCAWCMTSG